MSKIEVRMTKGWVDLFSNYFDLTQKGMRAAGWRGINRTLVTLRSEATKEARSFLRIKAQDIKANRIKMLKARGGRLDEIEGELRFSTAPMPLIGFVRGTVALRGQKGIKVKSRRRRVKYEVFIGRRIASKSGFIARVHSLQVFKRKASGGFAKQSTPSFAQFLYNKGTTQRLANMAQGILARNVLSDIEFRLQKAKQGASG